MLDRIVSSKLSAPKKNDDYVLREGLQGILEDFGKYTLNVVYGPAGSGKTSLVRNQSSFNDGKDVWINCDTTFNDFETFWSYFLAGLHLNYETYGITETQWNDQFGHLINDVNQKETVMIVLDDFHLIQQETILESFNYLLDHLNDQLSIVLTSRHEVSLDLMKRLMKDQLQIITEEMLFFDEQEAMLYLKKHRALDAELSRHIIKQSKGWIGAMHILSLAGPIKTQLEVNEDYLKRFIRDEMLQVYDKEEIVLIQELAYLPFFNKEIIDVLSTAISGDYLINRFMEQKMMLQDSQSEGIYRYHHLLQEAFCEDIEVSEKKLDKAAKYYEEKGYISEALEIYERLEDSMSIMLLLLEYPNVFQYNYYLKNLGVEESLMVFEIAYQKFFYHYSVLEFDVCKAMHQGALKRVNQDLRFESFKGMEALIDPSAVRDIFSPVDVSHSSEFTSVLLNLRNAIALSYENRYHEAIQALYKALESSKDLDNFNEVTYIYNGVAQNYEELGYLNDAFMTYEHVEKIINKDTDDYIKIIHAVSKTGLLLKAMNLDEADRMMDFAFTLSKAKIDNINQSLAYNRIEWYFLKQDSKGSELLKTFLPSNSQQNLLMYASLLKYPLALNELEDTRKRMFKSFYEASESKKSLDAQIVYIQCLDDLEEQIALVDEARVVSKKENIFLKNIELALLKLRLLKDNKDDRLSVSLYKEAIYYASEHRILSPFVIENILIKELYMTYEDSLSKNLSEKERLIHYEILDLLDLSSIQTLSSREREVLLCIGDDLSNKEIAERLFISLSTVKTHINKIYQKLEVNTRLGALNKARKLGII